MKKLFTLFAAASMVLVAQAGTRILYTQNFETVETAADAGWTSASNPGALGIGSDDFGKFLSIAHGSSNGRTYSLVWGNEIYGENASKLQDGKYTVTLDYYPEHKMADAKQSNAAITIMANNRCPDNQPFSGRWTNAPAEGQKADGYLFDLQQTVREEGETVGSIQFMINGNKDDVILLTPQWYTITLNIDTAARTVEYEVTTLSGEVITAGDRVVPEIDFDETPIAMYAEGIWIMGARCTSTYYLDNIIISCESDEDVANTPACALTRIGKDADGNLDLNHRAYTINFIEGEILHVIGTNGAEETVSFFDCDGIYEYTTTTSGKLEVWTTCGNAESEHVIVDVDCTPCALPAANAEVISVEAGYAKTYKLTVDNTTTPLSPQIFITYSFKGDNGALVADEEQSSGVTFTVPESGVLTVTTKAFGYQETTTTINNDSEYSVKYVCDFARMTPDDIKAAGFVATDDLNSATTSGEQNWTARKRLYYNLAGSETVNDEGNTVYTAVYPFGYIADDDTEHVLHRWIIAAEDLTEKTASKVFAHVTLWTGLQAKILQGVGLIQDATTNNYNAVTFNDLADTDIVVVNTINGYGANSIHPVCSTDEEFFAQLAGEDAAFVVGAVGQTDLGKKTAGAWATVKEDGSYSLSFNLYRIDTALTKATVFNAGESSLGSIFVDTKVVDDAYYTIDGMKIAQPTTTGIYIHNGKKVYIVK